MGPLFIAFVVVPVVELWLLIRIGRVFGFFPTVAVVLASALLGSILAMTQGRKVLSEWSTAINAGEAPREGVVSGVLVLLGALLLIVPGVLTDIAGLLLLVPITRRLLARAISHSVGQSGSFGGVQFHVSQHGGMPGGRSPFESPSARRAPSQRPSKGPPTEVGRVVYREGDVIDTVGEEVEE